MDTFVEEVVIAVVGKYTGLSDAYLSIIKAMKHASIAAGRKLNIQWVEATELETNLVGGEGGMEEMKEQYEKAWYDSSLGFFSMVIVGSSSAIKLYFISHVKILHIYQLVSWYTLSFFLLFFLYFYFYFCIVH